MVKYICDRCGREAKRVEMNTPQVDVFQIRSSDLRYTLATGDLCNKCVEELRLTLQNFMTKSVFDKVEQDATPRKIPET